MGRKKGGKERARLSGPKCRAMEGRGRMIQARERRTEGARRNDVQHEAGKEMRRRKEAIDSGI